MFDLFEDLLTDLFLLLFALGFLLLLPDGEQIWQERRMVQFADLAPLYWTIKVCRGIDQVLEVALSFMVMLNCLIDRVHLEWLDIEFSLVIEAENRAFLV